MCKIVCADPQQLREHQGGKKHASKVAELAAQRAAAAPPKPQIANPSPIPIQFKVPVYFTSNALVITNESLVNAARYYPPPPPPLWQLMQAYSCSLCMVFCSGPSTLKQHMEGKKHAAMVAQKPTSQAKPVTSAATAKSQPSNASSQVCTRLRIASFYLYHKLQTAF